MIIFKIIITVILVVGNSIYLANSIVALQNEVKNDPHAYFNPYIITISGICTMLTMMLLLIFMSNASISDSKLKTSTPTYELIHEPVYKKIN